MVGMHRTIKLKNFFIYIFILWYSTEIIYNSTLKNIMGISVGKISDVVTWLVFALLMFQIVFFQSYKKREVIIIVVITIPIIIATVLSGQRTMMSAWMFIVASKNVDLDDVIRTAYRILLVMLPAIMLLCLLGFIDNRVLMRGSVQRYSFGFSHPNQLGLRVFQLMACHCYVHRNNLKEINYLYIFLATLFLIRIPNSQAAYITMGALLFMLLLHRYIVEKKSVYMKLYEEGILYGALCLNLFSIIFSGINVSRNFILARLDSWLSSRFSVCHKVWMMYGVSFLGQRIYVTEEERALVGIKNPLWLDNAYVSILLRYGVLVFFIFSISYLYLIKVVEMQKEDVLVIILFLYALYGTIETGLYMITHNIFLITFSVLLYKKRLCNGRQTG